MDNSGRCKVKDEFSCGLGDADGGRINWDGCSAFGFSCTCCGECCRGRIDIRLNIEDLWLMARFMGLGDTADLSHKGLIREEPIEGGGLRYCVQFKQGWFKCCPFLENRLEDCGTLRGLCRLHPHTKPLVCLLAPMGREWDEHTGESRWFFQEPISGCPGVKSGAENYDPNAVIAELSGPLDRESHYYGGLAELQRMNAPDEVFREFHRMETRRSVDAHLEDWEIRLGIRTSG